jgi:putative spermidine/putrescine transport system permease protein
MAGRVTFWTVTASVVFFLIAPLVVVIGASFNNAAMLAFPPVKPSLRWYQQIPANPEFVAGFWISFQLAVATTTISCIVGTPASLALVRHRFPGSSVLNGIVLSPLILPTVVLGISFLLFLARFGLAGSFFGLVLAHTVLTVPYVVRTVVASLSGLDPQLEEAARNLGASPLWAFWRVTLPLIAPGLLAGGIFSFIISFDELVVTIFVAGPRLVTLPIRIFTYVQFQNDPFVAAVSTLLILMSFLSVLLLDRLVGVSRFV